MPSSLLFLIFINDLLDDFEQTTIASALADDLAIPYTEVNKESPAEQIQRDIGKEERWSSTWRLLLNPAKCKTTPFT